MSAWRQNMPRGMYLKSAHDASDISAADPGSQLHDYTDAIGVKRLGARDPIPIQLFVDYGLWFAERQVPRLEQEVVGAVAAAPDGFDVTLQSGATIAASSVVVASGH